MQKIREFHRQSIQDREAFWAREAQRIHWETPFTRVLDYSRPPFARWFVGGRTNLCYNAVDRWLDTQGDQPALIWVSTEVDQEIVYTRADLAREVNTAAATLQEIGVVQSDRVLVYLPRPSSCWPAPGSAPSIPSCSAASPRTTWPSASTTPSRG